jgi:hypothetical protein
LVFGWRSHKLISQSIIVNTERLSNVTKSVTKRSLHPSIREFSAHPCPFSLLRRIPYPVVSNARRNSAIREL